MLIFFWFTDFIHLLPILSLTMGFTYWNAFAHKPQINVKQSKNFMMIVKFVRFITMAHLLYCCWYKIEWLLPAWQGSVNRRTRFIRQKWRNAYKKYLMTIKRNVWTLSIENKSPRLNQRECFENKHSWRFEYHMSSLHVTHAFAHFRVCRLAERRESLKIHPQITQNHFNI